MKPIYLVIFASLAPLVLASCNESTLKNDCIQTVEGQCCLTIDEAISIYHHACNNTDDAMWSLPRCDYGRVTANWDSAKGVYDVANHNDNCEICIKTQNRLRFYTRINSKRLALLDSDRRLIVVKNRDNGLSGAFIMTIISDPEYSNQHRHEELCSLIHNDGRLHNYSGLIIYSKLNGTIIRVNKYNRGFLVAGILLTGTSSRDDYIKRVSYLKRIIGNTYFGKKLVFPRTKSGLDSLDYGWYDSLNPSICVDDTVVCDSVDWGNDWWDDGGYWGPDGIWYPFGDPGQDPGAGQYGGGGNDYFPVSQTYDETIVLGNKTVSITFEHENLSTLFSPKIQQLNTISLFQQVVSELDFSKVSLNVLYANNFQHLFVSGDTTPTASLNNGVVTHYSHCNIRLNLDGSILGYLEEFIHALQYTSANHGLLSGDVEFEAKVIIAHYLYSLTESERKSLLLSDPRVRDNIEYFNDIYQYTNNPTEDNRERALLAFLKMGYINYPMSNDAQNLDIILSVYHTLFPDLT